MKVVSNAEKDFISSIVSQSKRIDGRNLMDCRKLKIKFLKVRGLCIVNLGKTAVLAHVTARVTKPKAYRAIEGVLEVNFEVSPTSVPDADLYRSSYEFIELQKSLERCIRDSRCLDLETLCIVAGVKVWTIRVNIRALSDDGNVLECGSIAAVSALEHFKRPAVTVVGAEVTVHPLNERQPVPLSLHHMPIGIKMAVFFLAQGSYIVVDPNKDEEIIADGCYIIGMNDLQEVCMIHRTGSFLISEDTIQNCMEIANRRAETVIQTIRTALSKSNLF